MEFPVEAFLIEKGTGQKIVAEIRPAARSDLLSWTRWRYAPTDEDRDWDWPSILQECADQPDLYECLAMFTEQDLQGLMVLQLACQETPTGKAIAVDYLATNPANRHPTSGLKYVGMALMALAALRSDQMGAGELWLEALPNASGFYENLGMSKQPHLSPAGYEVFAMDRAIVKRLLDETRRRGILKV